MEISPSPHFSSKSPLGMCKNWMEIMIHKKSNYFHFQRPLVEDRQVELCPVTTSKKSNIIH